MNMASTGESVVSIQDAEHSLFLQRLNNLREAMEASLPNFEHMIAEIHTILRNDENMVHLLKDEDIGLIVAALSKRKNIVIAESVKTKGASKGKTQLTDFM